MLTSAFNNYTCTQWPPYDFFFFFFWLVSSAVGHGHDNTPTKKNIWSRKKNVSESPPLSDFFRAGEKKIGSRSSSETFCPPPPPSKHPGAAPACTLFTFIFTHSTFC